MGEVIQFIPKSERERVRLIRQARALYDSIFPPAEPISKRRDQAPAGQTTGGANGRRGDGVVS
jgi:hypothetical protein